MTPDPAELSAAQAAVDERPEDVGARCRLIHLLLARRQAQAALEQARQLMAMEPANGEAMELAAEACRVLGDPARAAGYQRVADALAGDGGLVERVPDTPAELIARWEAQPAGGDEVDLVVRARDLVGAGLLREARDLLVGAGVPDTPDAEAAFLLAQVLLTLGFPRRAREAADAGLLLAPNAPWGYRLRSAILLRLGSVVPAMAAAEESVRLAPGDPFGHVAVVYGCLGLDDTWGAREAARRVVDLAPELVTGHLLLARLAFDAGRLDEAERHYRDVLALEPDHPVARHDLGAVAVRRQAFDEAKAHFDQSARLDPDGPGRAHREAVEAVERARAADRRRRWARALSCLLNPVIAVGAVRLWQRNGRDGRRRRVVVLWAGSPGEAAVRVGLTALAWALVVFAVAQVALWALVLAVVAWRLAVQLAADVRANRPAAERR